MGKIVAFPGSVSMEELLETDVSTLTKEELLALIPQVEALYSEIEEEEPDDPESEEYYVWAALLEAMDDLLDEIQEYLDE